MYRHCSLLIVLILSLVAGCTSSEQPASTPKNVILMISDGCGPASMTLARDYIREVERSGHRDGHGLVLDTIQTGSVHTYATDARVTDSAAGATAYACGVKTYYTAVAVDTAGRKLGTILEGAEATGMSTGLVATSRITHATPAAFSSHVGSRYEEDEIARQQLQQDIEVIFGGGRRHFLSSADGGAREDSLDLFRMAADRGYHLVDTRAAFDSLESLPALGLFTADHMSYEIDREASQEPGLGAMTRKAISLLNDHSSEGFFLMVEGSRIDHAGHRNDPGAHLREILEFDDAVAEALSFARSDGQTLVVSVSDHETGGLTLAGDWDPNMLKNITASRERIVAELVDGSRSPADVMRRRTGIELSADENETLARLRQSGDELEGEVSDIISSRTGVSWSTGGHTAVDVNLYAYGPGSERFVGHFDNSYVGRTMAELLRIDLQQLTQSLQEDSSQTAAQR